MQLNMEGGEAVEASAVVADNMVVLFIAAPNILNHKSSKSDFFFSSEEKKEKQIIFDIGFDLGFLDGGDRTPVLAIDFLIISGGQVRELLPRGNKINWRIII